MAAGVPGWVRDAVFYQVFPDRFASSARCPKPGPLEAWNAPPTSSGFKGGDLLGIVERLDELADLGITALYLTPIFSSASNHRYHTYDYLAVDPMLGGDAALRELIDALHARGMRIVLDGVFNHVGRGFWPFHHVVENGLQSPYTDWFHLDRERLAAGHGLQPYPDRLAARPEAAVGPEAAKAARAAARAANPTGYAAWWNLPALPKLNTDHPPVREYIFSVAEHWLRFGIDGWRLDVPFEIKDPAFWSTFRRRCRAVNPEAYLVGEVWKIEPEWMDDRFDALMNYPLQEAIASFVGGPSLDRALVESHHELPKGIRPIDARGFAQRLRHTLDAYAPGHVAAQLNLLSSHDVPRFRSIMGGDSGAFLLGTLLQMTLPGAPCIYYGDEVGMEGGLDPDCRRAFPDRPEDRDEAVRDSVRAFAAARHAHPALRADRVAVAGSHGNALALVRGGEGDPTARGETAVVAVNAGTEPVSLTLSVPALAGRRLEPRPLSGFMRAAACDVGRDGTAVLAIPPRGGAVYIAR